MVACGQRLWKDGVTVATTHELMTAAELLRMPDDGYRYELVRGELHKMSPAGYEHGKIAARMLIHLGSYVQAQQLGEVCAAETGFALAHDPDTVRAPDVAFISRERAAAVQPAQGYFPGAPDLVVEVISPDDRYAEVDEKVEDWLDAGCQMIIVINPRRRHLTVTVYYASVVGTTLTLDDVIDGHDVVPGWTLPVRELFDV
jgi:Uma2 family endonuclease